MEGIRINDLGFTEWPLNYLLYHPHSSVDTWLTEFRIDRIRMVLQKGYILYV